MTSGGDCDHGRPLQGDPPRCDCDAVTDRASGERTSGRRLRSREVSGEAGVSLLSARKFWRALGFPNVEEGAAAFGEADVAALREVSGLVREGLVDEATALGLTRAVGRTVDRMASWQLQLVAEVHDERRAARRAAGGQGGASGTGEDAAAGVAEEVMALADRLESLVVYAWRRHLEAHVRRFVVEHAPDEEVQAVSRSVGFADLVSFTRVVRRLSERELAALVQRFEATASDIVASHGGRVVKTVGDEVLFVAQRASSAAGIALDVAEEMSHDPVLPDVRVGMATGPVVARLGDVFGTTVNRAARLTALTQAGAVLVDEATANALNEVSGFSVQAMPRRTLRGIGPVTPYRVTRRVVRGAESGPVAPEDGTGTPDDAPEVPAG
ncbi:adenylate/guanylate cyclase domain-containing protein [Thalassiella azotivora]